jgi:hypothetical protein
MIAPVSNELPCKQGILQEISQRSALVRRPLRGKRLSCSDFFQDSLLDLSGNNWREQGFGVFIRENCLRFRRPLVRKWTLVASSVWRLGGNRFGFAMSVLCPPCLELRTSRHLREIDALGQTRKSPRRDLRVQIGRAPGLTCVMATPEIASSPPTINFGVMRSRSRNRLLERRGRQQQVRRGDRAW